MRIEVFGTGCAKCKRLMKNVEKAVAESGEVVEVVKVEDLDAITSRGIMMTPALAVDGTVLAMGRVPSVKEIVAMIEGS